MGYLPNRQRSQKQLSALLKTSSAVGLSIGLWLIGNPAAWATTANQLQSQRLPEQSAQRETPVAVTGLEVSSTAAGVQINLQTAAASLSDPVTEVVGNALVIEIPNAVLALEKDQRQSSTACQNPVE